MLRRSPPPYSHWHDGPLRSALAPDALQIPPPSSYASPSHIDASQDRRTPRPQQKAPGDNAVFTTTPGSDAGSVHTDPRPRNEPGRACPIWYRKRLWKVFVSSCARADWRKALKDGGMTGAGWRRNRPPIGGIRDDDRSLSIDSPT